MSKYTNWHICDLSSRSSQHCFFAIATQALHNRHIRFRLTSVKTILFFPFPVRTVRYLSLTRATQAGIRKRTRTVKVAPTTKLTYHCEAQTSLRLVGTTVYSSRCWMSHDPCGLQLVCFLWP